VAVLVDKYPRRIYRILARDSLILRERKRIEIGTIIIIVVVYILKIVFIRERLKKYSPEIRRPRVQTRISLSANILFPSRSEKKSHLELSELDT